MQQYGWLLGWVLIGWLSASPATAQVRPGIKFGASTPDIRPETVVLLDDREQPFYTLSVEQPGYGFHGGVFIQMQFAGFFVQPEALYNWSSIDYQLDSPSGTAFLRETYRNIDFLMLVGLKSGIVRIGGGPVGHLALSGETRLTEYEGLGEEFEKLRWGWQAGLGLDLWKLHVDVRYEGNFTNLGHQLTYRGESFDFDTPDNRFLASIGFSF